jgi:serine protease
MFFNRSIHRRGIALRRTWQVEALETRQVLSAAGFDDVQAYSGSEILVKFRESSKIELVEGTTLGESYSLVPGLYKVNVGANLNVDSVLNAYNTRADVEYAQFDFRVQIAATPNDPRYSSQWGLNNIAQTGGLNDADIDAPEAWNTTTGSRSIIVGVIDTGIDYNHPDLAANIWRNTREIAGNGIDDDANGFRDDIRGWDFRNNDADPFDDNAHGTHVAGIIGAVGNNGVGVTGVAWNVQLMPLKFLGADGSGSTSSAVSAINYAVANGAKILNNSWGGGGFSQALNDAVARARAAGVIFVAAAGNEANNNDTRPSYPANIAVDNVLSVAATDSSDRLASFSNFGATTVDIAAPGVGILSTTPNNTYSSFSGTSMATPFVAGAAALVWSANPSLTYSQVIGRLTSSVDVIPGLAGKVSTSGRLNVNRALSGSTPVDSTAPRVLTATFAGDASGITGATLTFSEAVQTSTITASSVKLLGPSGQAIPATISFANGNSTVNLTFSRQTTQGTYSLIVEPTVKDVAGNLLNQDNDATFGEVTQDRFTATRLVTPVTTSTFTFNTQTAIRDQATTTVSLPISSSLTIEDINIQVNLRHTYDSDLVITAIHPDGTRVNLFNRRGGAGDNLTSTVFDDEATRLISQGVAPFTGSFRPETALSAFDGRTANGTWKLEITDAARADIGTLLNFSLVVTGRASTAAGSRGVSDTVLESQALPVATPSINPTETFSTNNVASLVATTPRTVSTTTVTPAATVEPPVDRRTSGAVNTRDLDYLFGTLGSTSDNLLDAAV